MTDREEIYRQEALAQYAADTPGDTELPPMPRWTQIAFWLIIAALIAAVAVLAVLRPPALFRLWPGLSRLFGEAMR